MVTYLGIPSREDKLLSIPPCCDCSLPFLLQHPSPIGLEMLL